VVDISHLLFANATLVFCEANLDHLRFLLVLFVLFEAVSGLKINLAKSVLVPVGDVDNMDELEISCGCEVWFFLGWLVFLGPHLGLME
jgi:hypothetical protein